MQHAELIDDFRYTAIRIAKSLWASYRQFPADDGLLFLARMNSVS